MAKIITSITYNNCICTFIKTIGNLSFYSFTEKNEDEKLLIVNKNNNDVLAVITACMGDGAYGEFFNGYNIEKD